MLNWFCLKKFVRGGRFEFFKFFLSPQVLTFDLSFECWLLIGYVSVSPALVTLQRVSVSIDKMVSVRNFGCELKQVFEGLYSYMRMQPPWKHLDVEQAIVLPCEVWECWDGLWIEPGFRTLARLRKRICGFLLLATALVKGPTPRIELVWFKLGFCNLSSDRGRKPRWKVETWLILPVVICLSQRLSHACLRISFFMANLRMAH